MQGMRRWIGANQTTSVAHGRGVPRGDLKNDRVDLEVDLYSTESLALQLLDPTVSKEEEAEYQGYVIFDVVYSQLLSCLRYVDQYQELLDSPSSTIERNDWEVYQHAIKTASGNAEEVFDDNFVTYVNCLYTGSGKDLSSSYEKWISGTMQKSI
jgi:hypothetical protein